MSRKHNARHSRTPGGYRRRLERRGLSKAPKMMELRALRARFGTSELEPNLADFASSGGRD